VPRAKAAVYLPRKFRVDPQPNSGKTPFRAACQTSIMEPVRSRSGLEPQHPHSAAFLTLTEAGS
jgi:hypothetical protein